MSNIDNLNFAVILDDTDFNTKVEKDIQAAKNLNMQLSSLLEVKSKIPQTKVTIQTKNAETSLERLNAYFRELEKADLSKVGKKLDVTPHVEQAMISLRRLEEEIEVIQELRSEAPDDMGLAEAFKRATTEADRLLATIAELRKTEASLNSPDNFKAFISGLTEQSLEQQRLIEYYKAEERASQEVAKEKAREEKAREKNAKALERERAAMARGEFREHIQSLTAANPTLRQMSTYYRELERELNKNTKAARGASIHQKKYADSLKVTSRLGREVKNAIAGMFSIYAASSFVSSIVRVTGEFEMQKTTLAAMLGNLSDAEAVLGKIKKLAVSSPFEFKELATYAKQLSAFSVPSDELFETTKMLADVSAGLGVGMDRLVLAFGQVKSAAFLRGQEVRQFTEAGIPILEELAKQFQKVRGEAISTGEVFDKISARQVPFEMVLQIFKDMTSEGGKFYQMQEIQSETLKGKISNLKDAYEMMLNEIGSEKSGFLKGSVDALRKMMENWRSIGVAIKTVVVAYGAYKAVSGINWIYQKINGIAKAVKYYTLLKQRVDSATAAQRAFNMASKANMFAFVTSAVVALGTAIAGAVQNAKRLNNELKSIVDTKMTNATKSIKEMDELITKLEGARQGTAEYAEIIATINRKYEDYLPKILGEAEAYTKVAEAAKKAKIAIQNKADEAALEEGLETINEDFYSKIGNRGFWKRFTGADLFSKTANRNDAVEALTGYFSNASIWDKIAGNYGDEGKRAARAFVEQVEATIDEYDPTRVVEDLSTIIATTFEGFIGKKVDFTANSLSGEYFKAYAERAKATGALYDEIEARGGRGKLAKEMTEEIQSVKDRYETERKQINENYSAQEAKIKLNEKEIEEYEKLIEVYEKYGRTDMVNYYKKMMPIDLTSWRKTVNDTLEKKGLDEQSSFGLWAKQLTSSVTYAEDMIKRYKELKDQIAKIPFDDKQKKNLQDNVDAIEAVAKALYGRDWKKMLEGEKKGSKSNGESAEEKAIKERIKQLQALQDIYEKFKVLGASDKSIGAYLKKLFPKMSQEDIVTLTNNEFMDRYTELLEQLRAINPEAAKSIELSIKKDGFNEAYNGFKKVTNAMNAFYTDYRKWKAEDFNLSGEGISLDISKIVSDYKSKTNDIAIRAKKLKEEFAKIGVVDKEQNWETYRLLRDTFVKEFGADAWNDFWAAYKKGGADAIDDLANKQLNYEKKLAQEKVTRLADNYVSDKTKTLNLTDWGDKNLAQIKTIQTELGKLLEGDAILDEGTIESLNELGISLEDFQKAVDELLKSKWDETVVEKIKKIQAKAKNAISIMGELGSSITNLGESLGSEAVEEIGKYLSVAEEVVMTVAECDAIWDSIANSAKKSADAGEETANAVGKIADSSDWITMIVKLVLIVVEQIANAVARTKSSQEALLMTTLEYNKVLHEINAQKIDTIFGKDFIKDMKNNMDAADRALDTLKDKWRALSDNHDIKESQKKTLKSLNRVSEKLGYTLFDAAEAVNSFVSAGVITPERITDFDYAEGEKDFLEMLETMKAQKEELLNATKGENGYKLDKQTKKDIEAIIAYYDAYIEASEKVKASVQEIFGSLADDIATNMIDAFVRTGDAAADLANVFESLGESFLKSMVQTWVLDNILSKYEDRASYLMRTMGEGNNDFAVKQLENLANDIMADVAAGADFVNILAEKFQEAGLLRTEQNEQSLAEGIKGITEDTANLLASYLNAIRADVSFGRIQWEQMNVTLQQILVAVSTSSSPILAEYQAQIAANTYDTAMNTQAIMLDLKSVITSEGGYTAIRTLS